MSIVRSVSSMLRCGNLGGIADRRQWTHVELALLRVHGAWNVLKSELAVGIGAAVDRRRVRIGGKREQHQRKKRE
ncbi:MAG TPA: hypothetical protein VJL61_00540 [Rhodanobacteraceae bacterium]|nr:hypothetical protein [Rhodanobacteraceae bacterium]